MKSMMVKTMASLAVIASAVYSQNMPFPQQKSYGTNFKKPSVAQSTMNEQVQAMYNSYISTYRKTYSPGYIIQSTATNGSGETATVSEAHGWGMVISAIMGDKTTFEGLYKVYQYNHNWGPGTNLMAWKLNWGGSSDGSSNATDGDLDIVYGLLIAYKQWGNVEYYNTAKAIANDIYSYNINSSTNHVLLGNWAQWGENEYNFTRPSDWMGGHFRTFADAFNDSRWDTVADKIYDIYTKFQSNSYATSGLISDFVYYTGGEANSTYSAELAARGENNQDKYATNAARVPWRIAADYAYSQDAGAKAALDKINGFLNGKSLTNTNIKEGYHLNGTPLNNNAGGAAYLAPFVAARIASGDQASLTEGWNSLLSTATADAYQAAIKLQSMLLISGNWWHYDDANTVGNAPTFDTAGVIVDNFGDTDPQTDLEKAFGIKAFGNSDYWKGGYGWMVEDWQTGKVKTSAGNVWRSETWTGDKLTDAGNLDEVFISGSMKVKFEQESALYTNFPNVDKDDTKTDWFDLSDMTGLTIKAKGTGTLTIIMNTDNEGTLNPADSTFWGGYATTITLDGTSKEYNIIAELFSAQPYSQEAANTWTWKANGCKKVSGISLFAESAMDAEIDYIKINGANIDNETFGFENPTVVKPVDGANVLAYGSWNTYADKLGSTGTVTPTKSGDSTTSLNVVMHRAAYSAPAAYDTYISLSGAFEGDFTGLTAVEIEYSSDVAMNLSLPITGVTDENGEAHFIILEAGSNMKVTKALADFQQPSWAETAVDLSSSLDKVTGVSIEIASDSEGELDGEITITSTKFAGALISKPSPIVGSVRAFKATGISAVSAVSGMLKADLSVPQAGAMDLVIVNTQGRVVARENLSVQTGVNSLALDMSNSATGIYYMVVKGAGVSLKQKFFLQ